MTDPVPRLPALVEAVLCVGSDLELRATLQHIVDAAADLTGARSAALDMAEPGDAGLLEIRTARPPTAGQDRSPHEPHERSDDALGVPILVDDTVFGNLYVAGKRADPFTDEDEQLLRVLATQAGVAIGNARLYETARQRERWIEGAAAVTTALLTGEDAAGALLTVAERARILADASAGLILQPTDQGGMRIVTAATPDGSADPGDIVGTTIEPGSPLVAQLLGGEPVFIDDSATDPRLTTHVRHRFGPNMMLPLQSGGRLIGTLALPRDRGGRPYSAAERLLAAQFASQAALALVLADAQHSRERLAVYEDRDRIARDLHDLVVQRLFATGMMLESTQRRSSGEADAEVREILGRAVDELQSTVQEVRTAIFALQQPPADAPTTLRGKVLRETAGAAAVLGFQPSTRFTGAVEALVPEPVVGHLLVALRRALASAARRSGVSRVEVTVDATTSLPDGRAGVRLTVFDDGETGEGGTGDGDTGDGQVGTTVVWRSPL
ncbi:GAF domain-containing protein [Streptomyces sp. NBC_01571]|uniref:GAF domain-containing protein n=1 Tax=Streptomyces sp. NBC_01571 TaxID=2975883 RepID=UPI00224FA6F8|nr:GAF domain-containing protein [Streptomyces sp. NBC_01571]MCX4574808.1 GAF domain-containing protein [Streptomyces sp. NBC_01571]